MSLKPEPKNRPHRSHFWRCVDPFVSERHTFSSSGDEGSQHRWLQTRVQLPRRATGARHTLREGGKTPGPGLASGGTVHTLQYCRAAQSRRSEPSDVVSMCPRPPQAYLQFETEEEARAMAKFYSSNVTASVCGRPVRISHSTSYPTIQVNLGRRIRTRSGSEQ